MCWTRLRKPRLMSLKASLFGVSKPRRTPAARQSMTATGVAIPSGNGRIRAGSTRHQTGSKRKGRVAQAARQGRGFAGRSASRLGRRPAVSRSHTTVGRTTNPECRVQDLVRQLQLANGSSCFRLRRELRVWSRPRTASRASWSSASHLMIQDVHAGIDCGSASIWSSML